MNTRQTINMFLQDKNIAIAGVSRNTKKFGYTLFHALKEKGYSVIPINPNAEMIDNIACLKSVSMLGSETRNLIIATNKRNTLQVVEEAVSRGIKNIWIQNGCETAEAIDLAIKNNINLITKACFFMYADPKGVHKFHRNISKWIGKYVKESIQ